MVVDADQKRARETEARDAMTSSTRSIDDFTWEEDPKPDERSAEEQAIADAVWKVFDGPVVTIGIGAEPPGTPKRRVAVAIVPSGFFGARRFRKRHARMLAAVAALVEPDAAVTVAMVKA